MEKRGFLGRLFFLLVGVALIGVTFVADIEQSLWFWAVGFVVIVLTLWLWRRKKKKEKMIAQVSVPFQNKKYRLGVKGITDEDIKRRQAELAEAKKRRPLTREEILRLRKAS